MEKGQEDFSSSNNREATTNKLQRACNYIISFKRQGQDTGL